MNQPAIREVLRACNDLAIPFMVAGSLSSNIYGVARLTNDADLVVESQPGQVARLASHLGSSYRLDPQKSFESITFTTKSILEVVGDKFRFELFELSEDPFDQERFQRRVAAQILGVDAWVPKVEDVIVQKLRWHHLAGRTKDWTDLEGIVLVQKNRVDWKYVESWCDRHGSRASLDELRRLTQLPTEQFE